MVINPISSQSISSSTIASIAQSSVNSWNNQANVSVSTAQTFSPANNGVNDLYFSNDLIFFGGIGNVLAVTQVVFRQTTGEIIEADIIINDNKFFSSFTNSSSYLGDVITHEVGHFFGLSHSQVKGATMFYTLFKGQHTLSEDDKAGIFSLYPKSSQRGTIKGKVVGGTGRIGIFGAQVQAISTSSGAVVAGAITDELGSFSIEGMSLDIDDTFYLYVASVSALTSLPDVYSSVRNDFCDGNQSYKGSFFQSCFARDRGYPQGISLTSTDPAKNVGEITIRCSLDVPTDYISKKLVSDITSIDMVGSSGKAGNALVGFFTTQNAADKVKDTFEVDLTKYTVPNNGNYYLDIKVVFQSLYSQIKIEMTVIETNTSYGPVLDSENNPNLDLVAHLSLASGVDPNNKYTFELEPTDFTNDYLPSSPLSTNANDYFPSASDFKDDRLFYFLILTISKLDADGVTYIVESTKDYGLISDNTYCADAANAYSVLENVLPRDSSLETLEDRNATSGSPIGCSAIKENYDSSSLLLECILSIVMGMLLIPLLIKRCVIIVRKSLVS